MSRIYFHSPSLEADVRGSERAWLGHLVNKCTDMAIRAGFHEQALELLQYIPKDCYLHKMDTSNREFVNAVNTWLNGGIGDYLIVDGEKHSLFTTSLNAASVVGGGMRFAALIHGQCEIHGWVDGPNREWLADLIEKYQADHILRANEGWESVVTLLRSTDSEPVVTSYSVCESFPDQVICMDAGLIERPADDDDDAWDSWSARPLEEQWSLGMQALRATNDREWTPSDFEDGYFGDGFSAFDLADIMWCKRLAEISEGQHK